ncbi:MAG: septation protein A [Hyphomicrobiaceae bacterium]|nr:septation protein A [Hyphomicrobiaceae bacterium]
MMPPAEADAPKAASQGEHSAETVPPGPPLAKLVLEVLPLLVFFVVNARAGIFWGTGCFMLATVVSLVASKALIGRIPIMPLVSGFFILVFGGLTLLLHDELFIKLKPTIVNLLFASVLFGGLFFGHSLLKHLFGDVFRLTDEGWRLLTLRWAMFFVALAGLNEFVWRTFSSDTWVSFKLFGILPLTMIFAIAQISLLKRHEIRD